MKNKVYFFLLLYFLIQTCGCGDNEPRPRLRNDKQKEEITPIATAKATKEKLKGIWKVTIDFEPCLKDIFIGEVKQSFDKLTEDAGSKIYKFHEDMGYEIISNGLSIDRGKYQFHADNTEMSFIPDNNDGVNTSKEVIKIDSRLKVSSINNAMIKFKQDVIYADIMKFSMDITAVRQK